MSLLADTHILLWAASSPERLKPALRAELDDPAVTVWFSVVSIWETVIKAALKRPDFRVDPVKLRRRLVEHDWRELEVTGGHVLAVADLPALHGDPFDRLLLAQAEVEGLTLLTADKRLARYGRRVRMA